MASVTILVTLLLISWFPTAFLILILILAVFFLKEMYTFKANNGTQVTSSVELTPTPFTDLLSALLGFFLTTLLSVLALALIVPLTLHLTIQHLKREHQ
ncbi:uncharacterized protein FIBRA_09145 [Fibroporia radiculosa]|uniref:Uncharacterized protein n=1 Tax=Fibroporia radiculosa TaxID=599839 RepID=J4I3W6_9APHY|nr:uncharacterized protein FIBRA_09145 [Fibroporia radiculosa]CCM06842.1 predicted protein [Fibroporia radiculosa]